MMNMNIFDSTRNGKLTKRAIIRRMWARAISGQTVPTYNMKYVARRINVCLSEAKHIVRWMNDHNMIVAKEVGANFVFSF